MEGAALRLWNIYGPGQALSNPYTGVLAIFASRIANGQRPMVFEDGQQRRDFVHVRDVARAFLLALDQPGGRRRRSSTSAPARTAPSRRSRCLQAASMGRPDLRPEITDQARAGDIRHNIPDLTKARDGARLRAAGELRRRARRARRMGRPPGGERPRRRGPRRARAARAGGMSGRAGDRCWSPAAPASSARTSPTAWRPKGIDVIVFDALTRAGVEDNLAWLAAAASATGSPASSPTCATPTPSRAPPRERQRRLPPGGAGGGDDEPGRSASRTSRPTSAARSTCSRRCGAAATARRWSSPAPTRSTATSPTSPLEVVDDAYLPRDPARPRPRRRRGPAARLPHALRLLEGRAPTSTCSTMPAASACRPA